MKLFDRIREIARNIDVRKPITVREVSPPPAPPVATDIAAREEVLGELVRMAQEAGDYDLPPVTHPDRFPACLAIVLKHEGGYVNHPRDPGGRTNLGVTQRVWEAWVGRKATEAEMRGLTRDMVAPLYRKNYWDKVKARDLPPGLDLHVFDFAVNAGPARAVRYLQMMVGTNPDGKIGPLTLKALSNYVDLYGTRKAILRYAELREEYYRQLGTFDTFGKGWLRRVREVSDAALGMGA